MGTGRRQMVVPAAAAAAAAGGALETSSKDTTAYPVEENANASRHAKSLFNPWRRRVVNRVWLEKVLLLVDAAQIYGLLWQLSQPWPWPARWLRATRWTNAFSLDVFSFLPTGAALGATSQSFSLWGQMYQYWIYALVWGMAPLCAAAGLRLAEMRWTRRGDDCVLVRLVRWENVLVQVFLILYFPIGLAVFRLVNCDASGVVSVDPVGMSECCGVAHMTAMVFITGVLGGGFLVGFPIILRGRIHSNVVHTVSQAHERFVRGKEFEFVVGTSESYLELHMPLYASYHRESVDSPVETCLLKLSLLLVFTMLRSPAPGTDNQGVQGTLFFLILLARTARQMNCRLFRCGSSSTLNTLVNWMLVCNGLFGEWSNGSGRSDSLTNTVFHCSGALCANGVRSALTVSTAMNAVLTFVNSTFVAVIGLYLVWTLRRAQQHGGADSYSSFWMESEHVRQASIANADIVSLVDTLQSVQVLVRESLLVPPVMRSFTELEAALERLGSCYTQAIDEKVLLSVGVAIFQHDLGIYRVALTHCYLGLCRIKSKSSCTS